MTSQAHRSGAVGTIASMLYQDVRRPFWQRHPLMASAGIAFAVWLLWHGAHILVAVALLLFFSLVVRSRIRAKARRDAGLRARADYEHRLNLGGDPRGIYGRYPPVQPGWFPDPQNRCGLRYFDGAAWTGYRA